MDTPKHTPGPWKFCTGSHGDSCICGLVWSLASDECVASVTVDTCRVQDHGANAPPSETMKANLRLVAAAPELLESLQAVLKAWTTEANWGDGIAEEHGPVYDAAKAVIQKAKGE